MIEDQPRDVEPAHAFTDTEIFDYLRPQSAIFAATADYAAGDGPAGSGVYFLSDGPALVYVGSSVRVSHRLFRHYQEGRKRFNRYAAISVPKERLLAVEGFYVLFMGWPHYNTRLIGGHFALEHLVSRAISGALWRA